MVHDQVGVNASVISGDLPASDELELRQASLAGEPALGSEPGGDEVEVTRQQ